MDFEWHLNKAAANERKHRVSFEEAREVFADYHSSTVADPDHSFEEDRFIIFGRSQFFWCPEEDLNLHLLT